MSNKVIFKALNFIESYMDDYCKSVIEFDEKLVTSRAKEYKYVKSVYEHLTDMKFKRIQEEDMFGSTLVLAYVDEVEVGAFLFYNMKNRDLYVDKIEIIEKRKGNGSIVMEELKRLFDSITIDQATPSAQPFYIKNGFEISSSISSCNKYPKAYWLKSNL